MTPKVRRRQDSGIRLLSKDKGRSGGVARVRRKRSKPSE